ncbi:MAG: type II secretion system protein [Bacilli bacterium]
MKKNLNRKGFTLIELLAVIVILGIIMLIAVPSISKIITGAKRDAFISMGQQYIDGVRTAAIAGDINFELDPSKVAVVSIRAVDLEKFPDPSKVKSSFNQLFATTDTSSFAYVVIRNIRSVEDPKYAYYYAAKDALNNCVALTEESELSRAKVIADGCGITQIERPTGTNTISLNVPSGTGSTIYTADANHIYLTASQK